MTREEQIREAVMQSDVHNLHRYAFMLGAEWADSHPRWISVEEQFPPIGSIVLVAIPLGGEMNVLPLSIKGESDFEYLSGMTHWMPMPQPPSVVSKSENAHIIGTAEHIKVALDVLDKKGGEE